LLAKVALWAYAGDTPRRPLEKGDRSAMKHRILVLTLTVMVLVLILATTSALPALGQPDEPYCAWYEAGFDRDFNNSWWAYWCHWRGYGWYLMAWWSDLTGYIAVY
jgi:hypothetical protein